MCTDCGVNAEQNLDDTRACGSKVIKVHQPWHIVQFMMCCEPGVGVIWNGCCCHADASSGCVFGNLLGGWFYALTSVCIVGMINSIMFGIAIYRKSSK